MTVDYEVTAHITENPQIYLKEESQIILSEIGDRYSGFIYDYGRFVNKVCLDIFENTNINHLDITIKYSREEVLVSITNEYDVNKELTSLDFNRLYEEYFKKYDFNMEYDQVLGLNKPHMKDYPVSMNK